jgi:integrase
MSRPNRGASLKWLPKRKCFYIVWYENGRERSRSTGTSDGREAESILAEYIKERQRKQRPSGPRDPADVMVAEVLDLYGEEHAPGVSDKARIGYAIAALLSYWEANTVADVTKETCRGYARFRGRAPATVRRELGTLRAAINYAHGEGRLSRVVHVELPAKSQGKDRWLTRSEAAALLWQAVTARSDVRLYLPLFIVLALYTGARKGAILSLRWHQVDLTRNRINFAQEGPTTNKRRAHIPIPRKLALFLRLAKRRGSDLGFVINDAGRQILDIGDGKHGSFGKAVARAGLLNVTPHTLRHTCGTWMAQKGVPLWQIGGWLGHSDARTTALYAHHSPDHLEGALAAQDRR